MRQRYKGAKTKVDRKTLAGVIVIINKDKSTCKVVGQQGLLHRAYAFHTLRVVPIASNSRNKVMDLEDASLHSLKEKQLVSHRPLEVKE
jgi:hypothetical protein